MTDWDDYYRGCNLDIGTVRKDLELIWNFATKDMTPDQGESVVVLANINEGTIVGCVPSYRSVGAVSGEFNDAIGMYPIMRIGRSGRLNIYDKRYDPRRLK